MTEPVERAEHELRESVLTELERREARRLVWGLVDGRLSADELTEIVSTLLTSAMSRHDTLKYTSENEVIDDLVAEGMIHFLPDRSGYRSRMAESIRLFSRLRQLFPKHDAGASWLAAPTLVADFRFLWRRRRYPRRNISPALALETFRECLYGSNDLLGILSVRLMALPSAYGLSAFQVDATTRLLSGLCAGRPQGTLVSAGTGSGKTIAFYLPALSWVAKNLATGDSPRVQVLAIYPRTELLKDQFSEVFRQAREYDQSLTERGSRPIRIAALYADVPWTAEGVEYVDDYGDTKWKQVAGGFVCPFLRCPMPGCAGELVWKPEDRRASRERLNCLVCGSIVTDQQVMLTRTRMVREIPDVLFLTSEMLNRGLTDSANFHLFGIGPKATRPPDLVLLDEVHLYGGTFGAHIGYLLRRWRSLITAVPHFVGLSATLKDGASFFANLTGLQADAVIEIAPRERDMVPEGAEYLLALRGDPVSRRALLSTTIQTMMLAARILDPRASARSRGFFGWRTFLFTDQIDSVARLLQKGRDAEGRYSDTGYPNTRAYPNGGLARLRRTRGSVARYQGGQDWDFIERNIGHQLDSRLRISRTTANDRGVDVDSEVVLATAALEVGYDDPNVGAVIQHKAPRDVASFLQRKGRAGRTRGTRPWTIVVLSDYGRDRISYQAYDQLFDPELPPRNLPLKNRYVQRIQSVFAFLEHLNAQIPVGAPSGTMWNDFSGPTALTDESNRAILEEIWSSCVTNTPVSRKEHEALRRQVANRVADKNSTKWLNARERCEVLVHLLTEISDDPAKLEKCSVAIQRALNLSDEEIRAVIWDNPRPLALAVIPTAIRRLLTGWRAHGKSGADYRGKGPLADFVPGELFSDLNLPEVELQYGDPTQTADGPRRKSYLPIQQAMSEFAPGKVSRRYDEAYWLAPDIADPHQQRLPLSIDGFYTCDASEPFPVSDGDGVNYISAWRPRILHLHQTPTNTIQDTSNARLKWHTQIISRASAVELAVPPQTPLIGLVNSIRFHSHDANCPAIVRRYASGSDASIRRPRQDESQDIFLEFESHGHPCVLGYEFEADAVAIELHLPQSIAALLGERPDIVKALRVARFNDRVKNGPVLAEIIRNPFQREWLGSVFLAATVLDALQLKRTLEVSCQAVATNNGFIDATAVLETIFQSPTDDDADTDGEDLEDRLRQDLQQALNDPQVMSALLICASCLWEPIGETWDPWLIEVTRVTLGGALLSACGDLAPDINTDGILVDLDAGVRADDDPYHELSRRDEIWLTETSPGGNGLLENVVRRYIDHPSRFLELVVSALGPNEYEIADQQLTQIVRSISGEATDFRLRDAVRAVRQAHTSQQLEDAFGSLRRELATRGYAVFHGFATALSARLLRPDAPEGVDSYLRGILDRWVAAEDYLGIELDNRIIAFLSSDDDALDQLFAVQGVDVPRTNVAPWRFNSIYSLLWPRGSVIRESAVRTYDPFGGTRALPERLLLEVLMTSAEKPVAMDSPEWEARFQSELANRHVAIIAVPATNLAAIARAIRNAILEPISLDYLNIYPTLNRIVRKDGTIFLRFEVIQPI